jgi:hypothetical protein
MTLHHEINLLQKSINVQFPLLDFMSSLRTVTTINILIYTPISSVACTTVKTTINAKAFLKGGW